MAEPFRFLSNEEFERLPSLERLTYLSDAMEELERTRVPRDDRGWHSLFSDSPQQQEPQAGSKPPGSNSYNR